MSDALDKAAALPWDGLGSFDREDAQNDTLRACAFALRALLPAANRSDQRVTGPVCPESPTEALKVAVDRQVERALEVLRAPYELTPFDRGHIRGDLRRIQALVAAFVTETKGSANV